LSAFASNQPPNEAHLKGQIVVAGGWYGSTAVRLARQSDAGTKPD
jgi:hypothetical protein